LHAQAISSFYCRIPRNIFKTYNKKDVSCVFFIEHSGYEGSEDVNRRLSPEDAALKLFDIYADKVYEFAKYQLNNAESALWHA
jgi:N-formylglutamate amidohydrolase